MTSHRVLGSFVLSLTLFLVACGGPPPGDRTPPSLVSSSPADGAEDVALNTALVLTFDEPVADLRLTPSPLVGLAAPVWDEAGQVATVAPSPAWPVGTVLSFAGTAEDEQGNAGSFSLGFTTLDDQDPPAAPVGLSATAQDGAIELSWTANSEPDLSGYLLFWGEDAAAPTGVVALPAADTGHTLTGLLNGTAYELYLLAEDEAGNLSAPSPTVTATPGDVTPPALVSSLPSDGVNGVGLVVLVRFVFSEPIDPASLQLFLYEVQAPAEGEPIDPGAPVVQTLDVAALGAPAWSADGTLVQYDDVAPDLFESDKAYRFQLQADDLVGNALPSPTTVSFLAGFVPDVIPPTVQSMGTIFFQDQGRVVLDFKFSEAMDQEATEAAFASAPVLNCRWIWQEADQVQCSVDSGAQQLQGYAVQFGTGARDLMGNGLEAVWNQEFSTPNFSPRMIDYTPKPPIGGLPPVTHNPYQAITWTFNEPVRIEGIAGSVRLVDGTLVDGLNQWDDLELSADERTITYRPPAPYPCQGHTYVWLLSRVYEQDDGQTPVRTTAGGTTASFRCGDLGAGSLGLPDARGE